MLDLRSTIADVRADGRSRSTRCSAHEDKRASLSISRGNDGRVLLRCHAGCASEAVLEAAGLTWADVHERSNGHHAEIVATYDYRDEGGALIYQVCRFEPKDFRQRRPDGSGEWLWNTKGVRSLLYHLDKLRSRDTVIVAEVKARSVMSCLQFGLGQPGAPGTGVCGVFVVTMKATLPFLISLAGMDCVPVTVSSAGFWPGAWFPP